MVAVVRPNPTVMKSFLYCWQLNKLDELRLRVKGSKGNFDIFLFTILHQKHFRINFEELNVAPFLCKHLLSDGHFKRRKHLHIFAF